MDDTLHLDETPRTLWDAVVDALLRALTLLGAALAIGAAVHVPPQLVDPAGAVFLAGVFLGAYELLCS